MSRLAAAARLGAVGAMALLLLPLIVNGSIAQTGLFAGLCAVATIGIFRHGLTRPLAGFEMVLIGTLATSILVGLVPWTVLGGQGTVALRPGELCADASHAIRAGFLPYLGLVVAACVALSILLLKAKSRIRASAKPDTRPPLVWWGLLLAAFYATAMLGVIAALSNQMTCSQSFRAVYVGLPVAGAFTLMLITGYVTTARIHRNGSLLAPD